MRKVIGVDDRGATGGAIQVLLYCYLWQISDPGIKVVAKIWSLEECGP